MMVALLEKVSQMRPDARSATIIQTIAEELCGVLRITTGGVDVERGFFELGMDSLMSVELKTRLEKRFGTRLPATLTFNYPSVTAVAGYIGERATAAAQPAANPAPPPVAIPALTAVTTGSDAEDDSEESLAAMLEARIAGLNRADAP